MFDLERAISEWRQEMRASGIAETESLDELEMMVFSALLAAPAMAHAPK